MRHPWGAATLALMTGILCAPLPFVSGWAGPAIAAALALVGGLLTWCDRRRLALSTLCIAFFLTGSVLMDRAQRPDGLSVFLTDPAFSSDQVLEIEGTIAAHPERRPEALVMPLTINSIRRDGHWQPIVGTTRLRIALSPEWGGKPHPFRWGDRVRLFSRLRPVVPSGNAGIFDFADWLLRNGMSAYAAADSPLAVEIISRPGGPFTLISSIKTAMEAVIVRHFGSPEGVDQRGALLEAFILGNRGLLEAESIAPLRRAGLMHVIAISGFHVWALNLICIALLRLARVPNRASYLAAAAVTILYWGLAGGRASVTRAAVVALVFLAGKIWSRRSFSINSLAFAAFCILVVSPRDLSDAGFQLTFGAALGIVGLYPRLLPWFRRFGWAGQAVAVGIASQLAVLPLTAWHFQMINLQSVITTFLVFPLVTFAVLAGFLFLTVLHLVPGVAELAAASLSLCFGLLSELAVWFDRVLPFALRLPAPPFWLAAFYGVALIGWVLATPRRRTPEPPEEAAPSAFGLVPIAALLILIVINPFVQPARGAWRLHQIDVGQGSSLLVETPDGGAALVDGGGTPIGDFDIGEAIVSPVLWSRGHRALDVVVATHGDDDHAEGLLAVLRNFSVAELWLPRGLPRSPLTAELIDLAHRRGARIRHFARGEETTWGPTRWRFYNPPRPPYPGQSVSNRNSLVAHTSLGDFSLLITGDADIPALEDIARSGLAAPAAVLCVPHHGSDDALSHTFLDTIRPYIALISAGRDNRFAFPRPAVVRALLERGITRLNTGELGAITLTRLPGTGFQVEVGRRKQSFAMIHDPAENRE